MLGNGPRLLTFDSDGGKTRMAHQSSWSRGQGSRRWPGRPGGACKRKQTDWVHQAVHRISCLDELPPPFVALLYRIPWGKVAAQGIYLFDQEVARSGIVYYAEYGPGSSLCRTFSIWVSEKNQEVVRRIIERLNPK